jgi:hypothetical protein
LELSKEILDGHIAFSRLFFTSHLNRAQKIDLASGIQSLIKKLTIFTLHHNSSDGKQ